MYELSPESSITERILELIPEDGIDFFRFLSKLQGLGVTEGYALEITDDLLDLGLAQLDAASTIRRIA